MTALEPFGLTIEAILSGDVPEFTPVEKPRKVKEPLFLSSTVDQIVTAAFYDLAEAYETIETHEQTIDDMTQQLEQLDVDLSTTSQQAEVKADDDAKLVRAENMLAEFERQMGQVMAKQQTLQEESARLKKERDEQEKEITQLKDQLSRATDPEEHEAALQRLQELEALETQRANDYEQLVIDLNQILDELADIYGDDDNEEIGGD